MSTRQTTHSASKSSLGKILFKWSFRLVLLGLTGIAAFIGAVWLGLFGPLPALRDLTSIQQPQASLIYSQEGQLMGKYFLQDRNPLRHDQIASVALQALVATEDARFYQHQGVDYRSLGRVLIKSVLLGQNAGGGSTLSMQLAKNLYPREGHGALSMPVSKVKEAFIALKLESLYSKEEILEIYLNTVPFGERAFGLESAAQRFFSKAAVRLEAHEAATLIGLLKATSYYNPKRHPERALQRRNVVLNQMHKYGYLDAEELRAYQGKALSLRYQTSRERSRLAPYFQDQLAKELGGILAALQKEDGSSYQLQTDGLRIYTTIDAQLQQAAEWAVDQNTIKIQRAFVNAWAGADPLAEASGLIDQLSKRSPQYRQYQQLGYQPQQIDSLMRVSSPQEVYAAGRIQVLDLSPIDSIRFYLKRMHTGFVAIDPASGAVRSWVGGVNHNFMPYDHVGTHMNRHAGSTFKPIVYAAALEAGLSPCDYIEAEAVRYAQQEGSWQPGNSDGQYEGKYSMEGALANSVNTVSVKLLEQAGIAHTVALARDMGLQRDIPEVPSIALGTAPVSPLEMATVYCAFANGGKQVEPWFIARIEDAEGRIIWQHTQAASRQVLEPKTADVILHMLKTVTQEGTARALRSAWGLQNDLAGKTGTTQDNADGWFMGIMPGLVTATWVGADYPLVHFKTTAEGQGARSAMPVFARLLQKVNAEPALYQKYGAGRLRSPSTQALASLDCALFVEERPGFFKRVFGSKKRKNKAPETRAFGEEAAAQKKEKKGFWNGIKKVFGKKDRNKKDGN